MADTLPPPRLPNSSSPEKKGSNCWVVGCGGCLGGLALFVIIGMVVVWQVKRSFMVAPFTPVEVSASDETQIRNKLQSLDLLDAEGNASDSFGIPVEGMTLSEEEVNYWISSLDNEVSDSVRVDFEPDKISAELRVGEPGGKRLMLKATFGLPEGGDLENLRLLDLKLGSFSLPKFIMAEIEKENMDLDMDPETQKELESKVERIEILKDQIRFIPKLPDSDRP